MEPRKEKEKPLPDWFCVEELLRCLTNLSTTLLYLAFTSCLHTACRPARSEKFKGFSGLFEHVPGPWNACGFLCPPLCRSFSIPHVSPFLSSSFSGFSVYHLCPLLSLGQAAQPVIVLKCFWYIATQKASWALGMLHVEQKKGNSSHQSLRAPPDRSKPTTTILWK